MKSLLQLLARILISLVFLWSGVQKILHFSLTQQSMEMHKIPQAALFLIGAILVEIGGGLALFFGFKTKWAALLVALYLIPTTWIFHRQLSDQTQLIQFLKNLAIIGGLLMLTAFDGGKFSMTPPQKKSG